MTGNLIVSTSRLSVNALAFQGIPVYTCFAQIRDMLMRKFGDEYVLLFARPVENTSNSVIDWYTPVQGKAQKLTELGPEKQEELSRLLAAMGHEILAYAEELAHSGEPLKVTRGNILKLALTYPDNGSIYVIGEQPVLVCWGFAAGRPGVEPENLYKLAKPAPPRASAITGKTVTGGGEAAAASGCIWWLLPLLGAALLFILLFGAVGPFEALSGVTLFKLPAPAILQYKAPDRNGEISALQHEIDALREKLGEHVAQCKPDVYEARPEQELKIPEKASDAAFLQGQWLCDTGLANKRTGEAVEFAFSFDQSGKGKGIIYEKDDQCQGEALAEMRNGVLHITLGQQLCGKSGNSYSPVSIECKNSSGPAASCVGANDDGSTWDASFRRIH